MGDKVFNVLGMIVAVAGITAVVSNKNSAEVVKQMGKAFQGSISAALGKVT